MTWSDTLRRIYSLAVIVGIEGRFHEAAYL